MIGCLPTQALAFLAVFVYATHATQAIVFEWKPGFTHLLLLLLLMTMVVTIRCRYSGETTEAAERWLWQFVRVERFEHRRECYSVRQSLPFPRLWQVHSGLLTNSYTSLTSNNQNMYLPPCCRCLLLMIWTSSLDPVPWFIIISVKPGTCLVHKLLTLPTNLSC